MNTFFRKFTSTACVFSLVLAMLSPVGAYADAVKKVMYYNDDFENYYVGDMPDEFTSVTGTQTVSNDSTGNFYRFSWQNGTKFYGTIICTDIAMVNIPESLVFEIDVRSGSNSCDMSLFNFQDASDARNYSYVLLVKPNGNITAYDGTQLGSANCKNNWVKVRIINDFVNKKHKYYIGNNCVLEKSFQNTNTTRSMSMIDFVNKKGTFQSIGSGTLDIDNIKMYSGTNLLAEGEEYEDAILTPPEVPEVWEHEIDQTALSINTSQYTEIGEYTSSSPSSYLGDFSLAKTVFDHTVCVAADGPNVWLGTRKYLSPYNRVTWDENQNFLAPIDFLSSLSNETPTYSNGNVTMGNFSATVGEKAITVGGVRYETTATVCDLDGVAYIPLKEYVTYKLKKYCGESIFGLAVIADRQIDLTIQKNEKPIIKMLAYLAMDLPNSTAIDAKFAASGMDGVHPRIFGTQADINNILTVAETDEILKARFELAGEVADKTLNYTWNYNLTSGTGTFGDIEMLYFAWIRTGDDRYAAKAEELALYIANLSDWDDDNYFLATSANMLICAEAYDLFYKYFSAGTKSTLANAIINKGLLPAQAGYSGQRTDWPLRRTNWNTVCNTGAMVAAATLMGEGYNDSLCLDILEKSMVSLGHVMYVYAGGAVFESVGYHNYATSYIAKAIFVLENVLGTSFGLTNYTGILDAGYYPYYAAGYKNTWALHDDDFGGVDNAAASYFAKKNNDLTLQKMRYEQLTSLNPSLFDLLCYMPEEMPDKIDAPLDRNFSYTELATSRSHWGQGNFLLGVHAGNNDFEHGQLDIGNFIYEAFGERFATDIGRDDYNLPNYQVEGLTSLGFYAKRAEGHNLFVINPDGRPDQAWRASSRVEIKEQKSRGVIYTVDVTEPYFNKLEKATRGFMLTNDRTVLVVQDEIEPLAVGDVYKWFWQTEADIEIIDADTINLTMNNKVVTLHFTSNVDFELSAGEAGPLPTSPDPDGQLTLYHDGFKRITASFSVSEEAKEKVYFRCVAIPYGHDDYEIGAIAPISEWTIPDGNLEADSVNASAIYVNGKSVKGFKPDVYDYSQSYEEYMGLPTVTATAPEGCAVTVRQPEDMYKTAVVTVTSQAGMKRVYTITFLPDDSKLLWSVNFDDATGRVEGKVNLEDTPLRMNVLDPYVSPQTVIEPFKGGKSVYFNNVTNACGLNFAGVTLDFANYQYWNVEFSIKVGENHDENSGCVFLVESKTDVYDKIFTLDTNAAPKGYFTYGNEINQMNYERDKWYHVVIQMKPGADNTEMTTYINGVRMNAGYAYNLKKADSITLENECQFSIIGGDIYLDDFNSWQSNTAYDPEAAGDVVSAITPDEGIAVNTDEMTITFSNPRETVASLDEKLAVSAGNTKTYHQADGTLISDENTMITDGMCVVVRSESGVAFEVYTLNMHRDLVLWSVNFDSATGRVENKQNLEDTPLRMNVLDPYVSPQTVIEPFKGGKSVYFNNVTNACGLNFAGVTLDFANYQYWNVEFSIKVGENHNENSGCVFLVESKTDVYDKIFTLDTNAAPKGYFTYGDEINQMNYERDKWYHVVIQMKPGADNTEMTTYINGVRMNAGYAYNLKKADSITLENECQFSITGGDIYIDDFNSWQSNIEYDPTIHDMVSAITSDEGVEVDTDRMLIRCSEQRETVASLDAKLVVSAGNTKTYHQADGTLISDENTMITDGMCVVVHSKSGVAFEVYTLDASEPESIASTVYEINYHDKTISGVPFMTPVEDFMSDIVKTESAVFTVTGPYAGASSTVTVGNDSTWKIVNKTYYDEDFYGITHENDVREYFPSLGGGGSRDYHFLSLNDDGDTLKSGRALRNEFNSDTTATQVWALNVASIFGGETIEDGDIVNLEFNFKTTMYANAVIVANDTWAVSMGADGNISALQQVVPGATYPLNEWVHFVISWKKGSESYKLYKDGKDLGQFNADINLTKNIGFYFSASPNGVPGNMYLDDIKLYKAATQEYDNDYMSGNQLEVTSDKYMIKDNVIYLDAYTSLQDNVSFGSAPVDLTGTGVNVANVKTGDIIYLRAMGTDGASRITKYVIGKALTGTESNKVLAGLKSKGWVIGAAYDSSGNLTDAKTFIVNNEVKEIDLSSLSGTTVKAFLWDESLKPHGLLTKTENENWN